MQLLLYVYATLVAVVVLTLPELSGRLMRLGHSPDLLGFNLLTLCDFVVFFAFCFSILLVATLTNFIKFHLKLVLENYTTIENLEREEGAKSKFDIGRRRNWEQVFGSNAWWWWLPLHTQASRPIGDGVRWRVHYTRVIDEDEEAGAEG